MSVNRKWNAITRLALLVAFACVVHTIRVGTISTPVVCATVSFILVAIIAACLRRRKDTTELKDNDTSCEKITSPDDSGCTVDHYATDDRSYERATASDVNIDTTASDASWIIGGKDAGRRTFQFSDEV